MPTAFDAVDSSGAYVNPLALSAVDSTGSYKSALKAWAVDSSGAYKQFWPLYVTPSGAFADWKTGIGGDTQTALAVDPATGDVYFSRATSIIKVAFTSLSAGGTVTTNWAGTNGSAGDTNATGSSARFRNITDLCFGSDGNLYALEGNRVRKITMGAVVTTLAGPSSTATGYTDSSGSAARFNGAMGICSYGGDLYVGESTNGVIRKVALTGFVTTQRAGVTITGRGIATDGTNFYYAKTGLIIDQIGFSSGSQTLLAGSTSGRTDGTGSGAKFTDLTYNHLLMHPNGNLYLSDWVAGTNTGYFIEVTTGGVVTSIASYTGAARQWGGKDLQSDGSILAWNSRSGGNRIHMFN